jgi:hypothetical protein
MAYRVAAIFHSRAAAERAADALADLGADRAQISLLARGEQGGLESTPGAERHEDRELVEPARVVGDSGAPLTTADAEDMAQGTAAGAVVGAVAGVAAGLFSLMVPGFGLITAAGPLAWALGGVTGATAAGAIAGGVLGALKDIGIVPGYGRTYEERLRSGDVLMTAVVPTIREEWVLDALAEHDAEDISFAESAPPAPAATTTPSELENALTTTAAYSPDLDTAATTDDHEEREPPCTVDYPVVIDDAPTIASPTVDPEAVVSPKPGWDADRKATGAAGYAADRLPGEPAA